MAKTSEHHHKLTNGVGKCSVPMWVGGLPGGFCDQPAFGKRPPCDEWRDAYTGERHRLDGKFNGYTPGLACPAHGGPDCPEIHIVFDAPPGPEGAQFVEVEDATGASIRFGEWRERPDGLWSLSFPSSQN